MNNKLSCAAIILLSCLTSHALGEAEQPSQTHATLTSYGVSSYGHETVGGINAFGTVQLDGTVIRGLLQVHGTVQARDVDIVKAEIHGTATFSNSKIQELLDVHGELNAKATHLAKLVVHGGTKLENSTISGVAVAYGTFAAKSSTFDSPLSVAAHKVILDGCTVHSLTIAKVHDVLNGPQIVELRNGTHIKGPIVFESGVGRVLKSADSEILGDVKGGEVQSL